MLKHCINLAGIFLALITSARAQENQFRSSNLSVNLSTTTLAFTAFSVDSLGQGAHDPNPVIPPADTTPTVQLAATAPGQFTYSDKSTTDPAAALWTIRCQPDTVTLTSHYAEGKSTSPFQLTFDQKANHATLLGLMKPGDRRMTLPGVLHLPDRGSAVITSIPPGQKLDYDARRYVKPSFVQVNFPAATPETPRVEYTLRVQAIHPAIPGQESDPLYAAFRRDFLNIFQVNPRLQMLANNASSDPVPFTLYKYAMVAAQAPPLSDGLTCLDLIRMTLDQYMAGVLGYGMKGYATTPIDADLVPWKTPYTSLDTTPSLLLAACIYSDASKDDTWARQRYPRLASWAREIVSGDKDGNGLIEYPRTGNLGDRPTPENRPANWWDTINFGHEDAYSNALAYKALLDFSKLAARLGHAEDAKLFGDSAAAIRSVYLKTFLNPATGLLAGWRSADGQLHDYAFTFVAGVAISFGLVDDAPANAILDKILAKMKEVGYTNFRLGLPGNLVPIVKADYCYSNWPNAIDTGEPSLDDGTDAFQRYENGGATGCFSYFLIHALYKQGRSADARRIFHPMLEGSAAGEFQGFCSDGKSRDWRSWSGQCYGYEGLLVDNYLPLLAVLDDTASP